MSGLICVGNLFELRALRLEAAGRVLLDGQDLAHPGVSRLSLGGASGCGKSTLLNVLAGLARPAGGAVLWRGRPLDEEGLVGHRLRVHRVDQHPLLPGATLRAALELGLVVRGLPRPTDDQLRGELAALGLGHLSLDQDPARLSGGEAQRVAVLRGLLLPVELLLLDEPSAGLDDEAASRLRERLLRPETPPLLVCGHDPRWEGFSQARWVMAEGSLHAA
jgi:ABC-type transport system involved in cytochrome bd biosynthesis fused ATPase/permease subunit